MQTILLYLLVMGLVVLGVFAVVWFVFGRGEDLPPIERGTTLTRLPRAGITGDDVRALTFVQEVRGYKASEVDWALEKVARELDELRGVVERLTARDALTHPVAERPLPEEESPESRASGDVSPGVSGTDQP